MKWTLLGALVFVAGCTLGSSRMGEQWAKDGANPEERSSAISDCTEQMKAQRFGDTGLSLGIDLRKQFSRDCMTAKGWTLPGTYARVALPPPPKRWQKDAATQRDFEIQLAQCRVQVANLPLDNRPPATGGIAAAFENSARSADNIATRDMFMRNCFIASGWELR